MATATTMLSLPNVTSFIRVAASSVALYDYLLTLPRELWLYRIQWHRGRLSLSVVLFFLIRYLSVATLVVSQIGWFKTGFSVEECWRYHFAAPILTAITVAVSQIIISVRAYAVSGKLRWVLWTLATAFVLCNTLELFSAIFKRVSVQNAAGNCSSGNLTSSHIAWIQYFGSMTFDTIATLIASYFLYTQILDGGVLSGLFRVVFTEGLIYFCTITVLNGVNIFTFQLDNISVQTSAANFAQVATMILSERFILNLMERRQIDEQKWENRSGQLTTLDAFERSRPADEDRWSRTQPVRRHHHRYNSSLSLGELDGRPSTGGARNGRLSGWNEEEVSTAVDHEPYLRREKEDTRSDF